MRLASAARLLHRACRPACRAMASAAAPGRYGSGPLPPATWQQSMLRVRDPQKRREREERGQVAAALTPRSLAFYRDVLGLSLVDKYDFPASKFSLYFLQSLPLGAVPAHEPGSDAAHAALWATPGVTLELTHNWESEEVYHAGNEPGDGFGHIALAVQDLTAAVVRLDAAGVRFKKRPEEGRMRSIAFVFDPDGYWVELVERGRDPADALPSPFFTLAQTMVRVKEPQVALAFYRSLGMTLVRETHASDFSIYFLATLPTDSVVPDPTSPEAREFVKAELYPRRVPVLELTHNHGTENQPDFAHRTGNEAGKRGFGHLGFLVPDVYAETARLQAAGVAFQKLPDQGSMKGLAFARDPDGYWIELIKRGQDGRF